MRGSKSRTGDRKKMFGQKTPYLDLFRGDPTVLLSENEMLELSARQETAYVRSALPEAFK